MIEGLEPSKRKHIRFDDDRKFVWEVVNMNEISFLRGKISANNTKAYLCYLTNKERALNLLHENTILGLKLDSLIKEVSE